MKMPTLAALLLILALVPALRSADAPADQPAYKLPAPDTEGWVHPFNGKDLDGWWGDMNLY